MKIIPKSKTLFIILSFAFAYCASAPKTLKTRATSIADDETGQLRLCKHTAQREYNLSGHEKNRESIYIRYDNRVAILSKLSNIILELRGIVENKSVSKENKNKIVSSIASLSTQAKDTSLGKEKDFCPIKFPDNKKL